MPLIMAASASNWPMPVAARPAGENAVGAGKAAAQQAPEVERVGGEQVKHAEPNLHPHHAAQEVMRR